MWKLCSKLNLLGPRNLLFDERAKCTYPNISYIIDNYDINPIITEVLRHLIPYRGGGGIKSLLSSVIVAIEGHTKRHAMGQMFY